MFMAFISWWYGKGLAWRSSQVLEGVERSMNTFSLNLLFRTWFSPFRQIDANSGHGGSLDVQFRKAFDKLFSRFIGAFLRTIVMMVGVFWITVRAVWGLVSLIIWVLMPVLPVVFIVVFITGWTPNLTPIIRKVFFSDVHKNSNSQVSDPESRKGILNIGGFNEL